MMIHYLVLWRNRNFELFSWWFYYVLFVCLYSCKIYFYEWYHFIQRNILFFCYTFCNIYNDLLFCASSDWIYWLSSLLIIAWTTGKQGSIKEMHISIYTANLSSKIKELAQCYKLYIKWREGGGGGGSLNTTSVNLKLSFRYSQGRNIINNYIFQCSLIKISK